MSTVSGVLAPAFVLEGLPASRRHRRIQRAPLCVRERPFRYENEGSLRLSQGAVSVGGDAWWSVALSVPEAESGTGQADDTILLRLERHGIQPANFRGETEMHFSLPRSEVDAVVVLLAGVVNQARDSGVIPVARAS